MTLKNVLKFSVWGFALLLLTMIPITATIAQDGFLVRTTENANMRSGPGTEFEIITTVSGGTTMLLDGRNLSGSWVRGVEPSGFVGWVSSGLVGLTLSDLNGMPIIDEDTPFLLNPPRAGAAPSQSSDDNDDAETNETTSSADDGDADEDTQEDTSSGSTQTVNPRSVRGGLEVTATNNVNMRSGPGTSFRRVGGVFFESPLVLDGRNADSTWVRGVNSDGVVGWVAVSFVDITPSDLASLRVVTADSPFGLATGSSNNQNTQETEDSDAQEAATPLPPVTNSAPVAGFAYGGHVNNFGGATTAAMNRAGMTWVKKQVRAGGGRGEISSARAAGFRILLGVVGDKSRVTDPAYLDQYAGQLADLAAAGADAIEVWNEPNIDREWAAGAIDPGLYTDMLRRAYTAIKQANPNTLVISGAPAPTGFFGGCSGAGCNDDLFIQGMAAAGAADYMDCIGIHYNEGIVPPTQTSGDPRDNGGYYTRYLQSMTDVYYNAFGGRRPVCYTELGYLTPEGYGPLPGAFAWAASTTIAQQAAWLDQAVDISRNSGKVRLVIIWNVDFTNYGADPMAGYAMIRADGSCPACDALGS